MPAMPLIAPPIPPPLRKAFVRTPRGAATGPAAAAWVGRAARKKQSASLERSAALKLGSFVLFVLKSTSSSSSSLAMWLREAITSSVRSAELCL